MKPTPVAKALKKLLPLPAKDFTGIFTAMKGLPVTIRLLDPPLHEFLPHETPSRSANSPRQLGVSAQGGPAPASLNAARMNPMLGHRGCRLAVTYPEILTHAGHRDRRGDDRVQEEEDRRPIPEIMIPLVGTQKELVILRVSLAEDHRGREEGEEVHRQDWTSRSAR